MGRTARPIAISSAIETKHVGEAVQILLEDLEKAATAPGVDTLLDAKRSIANDVPEAFSTLDGTISCLARIALYDHPLDWWSIFPKRIDAVTAEQVSAAAKKWLDPTQVRIVIVGDATDLRAQLAAHGVTDVEVRFAP